MHNMENNFHPIPLTNNYLLLMFDTDEITDNFTFFYFKTEV